MNKVGQIYIGKGYFGNKPLNSYNAYVGTYPLIYGTDFETLNISNMGLSGHPLQVKFASISSHQSIYYSRAKYGPYTLAHVNDIITLSADLGRYLYLRGALTGANTDNDYTNIQIISPNNNSQGKLSGKVRALFNGVFQYEKCGYQLFKNSTGLSYTLSDILTSDTGICNYAFQKMFDGCRNLTSTDNVISLPYTTLATGCYQEMFKDCRGNSMKIAPELPAKTLCDDCYKEMFYGCGYLNEITMLATSGLSSSNCMTNWVYGVNASGTFTKDSNTVLSFGTSGIPSGWTVQNI